MKRRDDGEATPSAPKLSPLEVLTPADRAVLALLCQGVGIPIRCWDRVSWIRICVEVRAVTIVATRLRAEGMGKVEAREEASVRLGVNPATHYTRIQEARRKANSRV